MGLIKLASSPIIVINKSDPNAGSSKTFNTRNVAAATAGAVGGFAGQEAVEHLPNFDKLKMSHRFGRRMGTAAGAFIGAAGTYSLLKKHQKDKKPDMIFY